MSNINYCIVNILRKSFYTRWGKRKSLFVSNSIYYGERALAQPTPKLTRALLTQNLLFF